MRWRRVIADRLRALRNPARVHDDIEDELQFHLEMRARENARRGMTPDEAERAARRVFGHLPSIKQSAYDVRGGGWFEAAWQDLRYALRSLRASPIFTAGVMLTLGLGIGVNAVMFCTVDQLLLRPPAYLRHPESVHRVYLTTTFDGMERTQSGTRFPRYVDLARFSHASSTVAAFATRRVPVGEGVESQMRSVTAASASYFDLFDARPALGRFFTANDDRPPTGTPVVVLGYGYWRSEYGGRDDVLGTRVRVGRTVCTVIGVAPEGFSGVADQGMPAMYVPLTTSAWDQRGSDLRRNYDYTTDYGWFWLELVAERRPGVSIAAATADLTRALELSYEQQNAATRDTLRLDQIRPRAQLGALQAGRGPLAGPDSAVLVWISGVALIVLLIGCANIGNLLLLRALGRRHEIALRLALGATRARLAGQLLMESLLLALLGGLAGLAAAQWGGGALRALFVPRDVAPAILTDPRTLVFALAATLVIALLTGLAPLSQTFRYRLSPEVRDGARSIGGRTTAVRTTLLLLQAAFSVLLLVGAGLFARSLHNVRTTNLGFDVDPLVLLTVNLRGTPLSGAEQIDLERRLVEEARRTPGVVSATQSPSIPYASFEGRALWVPGVDNVDALGTFYLEAGNADFFSTHGTRLLRGRGFTDDEPSPVVVVSEDMAERLWPGDDPIGKCIHISEQTAPCATVIGVSENRRIHSFDGRSSRPLQNVSELAPPDTSQADFTYIVPIGQFDGPAGAMLVRVAGDADAYVELLRQRLQRVMPGPAFVIASPLSVGIESKMRSWRIGTTTLMAFAPLALTLAGIGLYTVISYGVSQRRREIGVRLALGASRARIMRLIAGDGLRFVSGGVALGLMVAFAAARWIAPLLFEESATDPLVYAAAAAILIVVALAATALPARSAARVDPNIALRVE